MLSLNRIAPIETMKFKIALLLTVLAAGLIFTGCASMEDDSSAPPAAPHSHTH
jgi:outer membrane PBP1 activator LpoA protein